MINVLHSVVIGIPTGLVVVQTSATSVIVEMTIEPVGVPLGEGNDTYTATTSTISGGSDRDIYQCTASNGVASDPTNTVELRGISKVM